jgi:hypothetical protein
MVPPSFRSPSRLRPRSAQPCPRRLAGGVPSAIGAAFVVLGGLVANGCGGRAPGPPAAVTDPAALQPPPAGEGVQMKTDAFTVPAGTEVQSCYFFKVSELASAAGLDPAKPVDVHRVQIVQKAGSHHMNLFRVRTIHGLDPAAGAVQTGSNGQGPCFVSSNWADWPLIVNDQGAGSEDWSYPNGVVNELNPPDPVHPGLNLDEVLMLQTHYVNATTQGTPDGVGQVAINLWTLPAAQVTAQMGTVFATNQNISVCQGNPTPSYSSSCHFNSPNPVTIIGANGHFHSRGTEFDIYAWDGTSTVTPDVSARFYQSKTWNEPPMLHSPGLEVTVPANGGIWYTCDYQWQPPSDSTGGCSTLNAFEQAHHSNLTTQQDCCYTFGPQVDANEHCNAFVYYYPKQDNVNCF